MDPEVGVRPWVGVSAQELGEGEPDLIEEVRALCLCGEIQLRDKGADRDGVSHFPWGSRLLGSYLWGEDFDIVIGLQRLVPHRE